MSLIHKSGMKVHHRNREFRHLTTYILSLGFLILILVGGFLLTLPVSSATGEPVGLSDAFFVATSAVCVTGLVTVPTFSTWSHFGQFIIMILIQVGGLGFVSFTVTFFRIAGKRIGIRERQLIQDAHNLSSGRGLKETARKILLGTFLVEAIGALLYCIDFVPRFGIEGVWKAIFMAVSCFCNAGMDLLGPDSLAPYVGNVLLNFTTITLIILSGLGFPIWFMVMDGIRDYKSGKKSAKGVVKSLPVYAKLVIVTTLVLIVAGAALVFFCEYDNPDTLGSLPIGTKLMASLFQSVTTRTAGFFTIRQEKLYLDTVIVSCILMFIGGSPSGTAGGIKTTTIVILLLSVICSITDRNNTEVFHHTISAKSVRRAISIFTMSFCTMIISLTIFCMVQDGSFEACIFEVVSAIATVGLSRDLTGSLSLMGKIVIIITMYLGRIGPISLGMFYNTKKHINLIHYPEAEVPVG